MKPLKSHTALFSRKPPSDLPPSNPKWDKLDVTEQVKPFSQTVKSFHKLQMGRIAAAIYLNSPAFGPVVLEHIPEFHHNTLEVYNLRVGHDGVRIGYLFRSPLRIKCDPYFVMFIKRGLNPINDVIKHPVSVEKRYVLQEELVFHTHETGYLITRVEDNGVTRMLNQ